MSKYEDDKPYTSLEDWKKEVAHLKWPSIILIIVILIIIIPYDVFF